MAVVAALELEDRVAAGVGPRQPDRAHHGLGARADETHALHRGDGLDDHLGQLDFERRRRAVAGAPRGRARDRFDDGRRRMAQDQRPPGHHIVHEGIPVHVVELDPPGAGDEVRQGPDRLEGADRAVHPARHHPQRGLEKLLGIVGFHNVNYGTLTCAPGCVKEGIFCYNQSLMKTVTVTHWPANAGQVTINKIRARLEQEGLTPSRFDMMPGDAYGDHAHPDAEIRWVVSGRMRSEEHTSELQSRLHLVCRLLLEKKKTALSAFTWCSRPATPGCPTSRNRTRSRAWSY